jgi:glycosyltransferase involved in cell wall biosynthesis
MTPLLGPVTGIGRFVTEVVAGLRDHPEVDLRPLVLSWRGRDRLGEVAAGLPRPRPLAARPCRWVWARLDHPTVAVATGAVDVVHGTNYVVPPGGRARELVSVHDLTAWQRAELVHPASRAYPRLVARALGRGAHVHVISRFVGDEVSAELGVPAERVHVVHPGVADGPAGDPARGRDRAGADEYLLAVGTVEPRKDYPGLVEALARLNRARPELHLVVAGGEGWGSASLDVAVERTRTGPRVRRLGFVSAADRADLLAGARALVYPSLYEGFGFVPLEAMAAGVPVVATRAGAVPEVVGDAAELCPVGDPDALADAVERVLADDGRAAALVTAGRRRVQGFRWSRTVNDLAALYARLAG